MIKMQKFQLGKTPATFKREVLIDMHDGSKASIIMDFKYRTRTEYAMFIDDIIAEARAVDDKAPVEVAEAEDKLLTMKDVLGRQDDMAINTMLKIAEGWSLEEKFNKTTLREMQDKFPNAFTEINEAYRASVLEGRLKN
jgi:hypothetical protein